MKRLYAGLVLWLLARWNIPAHRSGGSIVLHGDEVRGVDLVSRRVVWRISKNGSIAVTGAAVQPSGDRSDRQAGL